MLYVSPPTCVTHDLSARQNETSAEYIGELHNLANVTPVRVSSRIFCLGGE